MKRCIFIFSQILLGFLIVSCGPSSRYIALERRADDSPKIEFNSQSIALTMEQQDVFADSIVLASISMGLAEGLEQDLGIETETLPVYTYSKDNFSFASKTSMLGYSALVGTDMLVVLSELNTGDFAVEVSSKRVYTQGDNYFQNIVRLPFKFALRLYDADKNEVVYDELIKDTLYWNILLQEEVSSLKLISKATESIGDAFQQVGQQLTEDITPKWQRESRLILIYDSELWNEAYSYAKNFQWEEAIRIWTELFKTSSTTKSAHAAFNIAQACEIIGNYELAEQWLDYSCEFIDLRSQDYLRDRLKSHSATR